MIKISKHFVRIVQLVKGQKKYNVARTLKTLGTSELEFFIMLFKDIFERIIQTLKSCLELLEGYSQ